jgi:hypothetical protein
MGALLHAAGISPPYILAGQSIGNGRVLGMTDEQTDQFKAIDLADGFHEHDMAALARLTPAGRAEQRRLRERLHEYVDGIWDHVKAYAREVNLGGDPLADDSGYPLADDPSYSAVAGMRDLTAELCSNAEQASVNAGDELDD